MSHMWEWHVLAVWCSDKIDGQKSLNWKDSAPKKIHSDPFQTFSCEIFLVNLLWLLLAPVVRYQLFCLIENARSNKMFGSVETPTNNLEEIYSNPVEDLVKCQTGEPSKCWKVWVSLSFGLIWVHRWGFLRPRGVREDFCFCCWERAAALTFGIVCVHPILKWNTCIAM